MGERDRMRGIDIDDARAFFDDARAFLDTAEIGGDGVIAPENNHPAFQDYLYHVKPRDRTLSDAFNAGLNRWISVKDRLPEYNVPVLTCDIDYPDHINPLMLFDSGEGWLWAGLAHSWNISDPEAYECDDEYSCTHWMPLPKGKSDDKRS